MVHVNPRSDNVLESEEDLLPQMNVNYESLRPSVEQKRITLDRQSLLGARNGAVFKDFVLSLLKVFESRVWRRDGISKDLLAQIDVNSEPLTASVEPKRLTLAAQTLLSALKGPRFKRFGLVNFEGVRRTPFSIKSRFLTTIRRRKYTCMPLQCCTNLQTHVSRR